MSIVPLSQWLAHRPRRGAIAVDTVVLHADEHEDVEALVSDLRSHDRSYHYIIDRDGTTHKAVPFSAVAFHCGNSYGPHEASRGMSYERDATGAFVEHPCVNDYSIGICFVKRNTHASPYSKEQTAACAALLTGLKTPLPKLKYLTTHSFVAPGRCNEPAGLDILALARDAGLEIWIPDAVPA